MSVDRRIAAFMTIADEELGAAKLLVDAAPRQAAYYVQQAAEKAARAVLARAGVAFGTSHNFGQMAAALPGAHPLRERVMALDKFSGAATRYRYPSENGRIAEAPLPRVVKADIAEVEIFIAAVRNHVAPASSNLAPPRKPRP